MPISTVAADTPTVVPVGKTVDGYTICIHRTPASKLLYIKTDGPGPVPGLLSGKFTRYTEAMEAVKRYLDTTPVPAEPVPVSPELHKELEARKRERLSLPSKKE